MVLSAKWYKVEINERVERPVNSGISIQPGVIW